MNVDTPHTIKRSVDACLMLWRGCWLYKYLIVVEIVQVVHKMLDEAKAGETLLGLSNWELDPAKMNRGVHLHRPPPTVDDLTLTAEGMLRCVGGGQGRGA